MVYKELSESGLRSIIEQYIKENLSVGLNLDSHYNHEIGEHIVEGFSVTVYLDEKPIISKYTYV